MAYRLLDAGRVVKTIEAHSPIGERPNERQARELAPLAKKDPEEAARLWAELVAEHGEKLTATDVRRELEESGEISFAHFFIVVREGNEMLQARQMPAQPTSSRNPDDSEEPSQEEDADAASSEVELSDGTTLSARTWT
jgi:hypothetical protein